MRVLSVDPGLSGGIAVFDNGELELVFRMPTLPITKTKRRLDVSTLGGLIGDGIDWVITEKSQSFPIMGKVQNFSLGYQFGVITGLIEGHGCRSMAVRPQEWKKLILVGYNQKDKSASIDYCLKRYPDYSKLTDGEADAICIGLFGLESNGGALRMACATK